MNKIKIMRAVVIATPTIIALLLCTALIILAVGIDNDRKALQRQHDRIRALEYPYMSLVPTHY